MITLTFPDGSSLSRSSYKLALRAWGERQWHKTDTPGWSKELAKRAYIWSGSIVNPKLPASQFLHELEAAGLVKVERS